MFIITMGMVSATDLNNTESTTAETYSVDMNQVNNIYFTDIVSYSGGDSSIDIHTKDSYNPDTKTWVENGVDLSDVDIKVLDSSNNIVFVGKTGAGGAYSIGSLAPGNYKVQLSYSTYETHTENVHLGSHASVLVDYMFVPDIMLLVSYNAHSEKVDYLMNLSKRVAYISTTDYDKTREWLLEYANFIHVDMFAEGYSVFTSQVLKDLLSSSPANANYNVAYTFGVYTKEIFKNIGIHFVGASESNNSFNTIENTYIGSYFQAHDIANSLVLKSNMENYLKYVYYLINPQKYTNPTLKEDGAPQISPECGFYHPDIGMFSVVPTASEINHWILSNPGYNDDNKGSLNWMTKEYQNWVNGEINPTELFRQFENKYMNLKNPETKFIAIASYYCGGDVVDALIRAYEASGRAAFNVFKTGTTPSMSSILLSITQTSQIGISGIASLYSWSLAYGNGSAEDDLSKINLTVVKGLVDISQTSFDSEVGAQMEWTYSVSVPSFEGVFGPVILSYKDNMGKVHVVQSGIEKMVKMTTGWADLKDMDNSSKVISIVLYNYPPGKAEIGASYLDIFQSVHDLLVKLYDSGYDIGMAKSDIPSVDDLSDLIVEMGNKGTWAQGLLNKYVEKYWNQLKEHNQLISLDEFNKLTSDMNKTLFKQMVDRWGSGLGEIMVYNDTYIVIPGMWFGNIFITFQPSRGWEEVQNYHDLTLPPHQQYVTFYKWLDKTIDCDAIINLGTHGTVEWLPGRNVGVHEGDWTFELTLTPTIYPYIVSNPGEAMVARDRIGSMMITHMTPAMVISALYGNYTTLSNYIDHYNEQVKNNVSANAEEYKKLIIELAPTLGFDKPVDGQSFDNWLEGLHNYLDSLEDDFNTFGLHTIGKVLNGTELIEEVITITTSRTEVYTQILHHLYPELKNKDFYDDIKGNRQYEGQKLAVMNWFKLFVEKLVNGEGSVKQLAAMNEFKVYDTSSELYESLVFASKVISQIQNNNEWDAILGALSGSYITAGLFADPAYSDSIPTGHLGYSSDASKMPSEAAYESAVKIVDLLLANYYEQHGEWPELTALVLWGTEILRTEGIGVAEFMYFLGCKPIWSRSGNITGVELIPINELTVKLSNGLVINRPRVDVFASMVTSNTKWISLMLNAVNLALNSKDDDISNNFLKKHYAENPMTDRLFGLPGAVLEGTGMNSLIPNTANWNITTINADLAEIYLNRVSYSWTLDEKGNIVINNERANYEYLLGKVDLITQNFDSTWRFLDSDDYYDWFGGLYNAAKQLGANPDTGFVDIRNKNEYIVRTYEDELEFEIRSTMLNPLFINSLFNTNAGQLSYAAKMQNLYGGLIVANIKLNTQLGNDIANTYIGLADRVNNVVQAAAWQSMAAWMMYLNYQGKWDASPELVTKLADNMIKMAIQYGVACCHHTCKNLDFNMKLIQSSSLSASEKAKYSQILAEATLTDPIFVDDSSTNNPDDSKSDESNNDTKDDNQVLINGTDNNEQDSNGESGGATAAGLDTSINPSDAKSPSSQSKGDSSQSDSKGKSSSNAYEVSKSSTSKSAAGQSSTPIILIIAVICLIAIFVVGYARNKNNNDDDEY
nr:cobaltochelatase subunit CobN [uncultured Methanobrevibacter sp.]